MCWWLLWKNWWLLLTHNLIPVLAFDIQYCKVVLESTAQSKMILYWSAVKHRQLFFNAVANTCSFPPQPLRNDVEYYGRSSRSPVMLFDIQDNNMNANSFTVNYISSHNCSLDTHTAPFFLIDVICVDWIWMGNMSRFRVCNDW